MNVFDHSITSDEPSSTRFHSGSSLGSSASSRQQSGLYSQFGSGELVRLAVVPPIGALAIYDASEVIWTTKTLDLSQDVSVSERPQSADPCWISTIRWCWTLDGGRLCHTANVLVERIGRVGPRKLKFFLGVPADTGGRLAPAPLQHWFLLRRGPALSNFTILLL